MEDWTRSLDTTPAAAAVQIAAYRRLGGSARVAIAFRLGRSCGKRPSPGSDGATLSMTTGRRAAVCIASCSGDVLMREAYPDEALVDP